jgi:hypothetical protein
MSVFGNSVAEDDVADVVPLMSMSALQMANDSGFASCPYMVKRALGFMAVRCSSAIESMPTCSRLAEGRRPTI